MGISVDEDGRKEVDGLLRELDSQIPHKDSVYEYYVDPKKRAWARMVRRGTPNQLGSALAMQCPSGETPAHRAPCHTASGARASNLKAAVDP